MPRRVSSRHVILSRAAVWILTYLAFAKGTPLVLTSRFDFVTEIHGIPSNLSLLLTPHASDLAQSVELTHFHRRLSTSAVGSNLFPLVRIPPSGQRVRVWEMFGGEPPAGGGWTLGPTVLVVEMVAADVDHGGPRRNCERGGLSGGGGVPGILCVSLT
ncbi:hypothetical protein LZ554_009063 [Drepanopeziza brunnea f. sp. 'monogermtubi']|nr:hypothetical protein LZ554_009063 [Drepanopeziza brunnea f. sp. 'monogermtubi']